MMTRHSNIYSHYVRLMKVLLPLGVLFAIGFALGWPYLVSLGKESLTMVDVSHPAIKENRMVRPHYLSTDEKGQPFRVNAEWAKNRTENIADLVNPQGAMTIIEGETFTLQAKKGHYDSQKKVLNLKGDVILTSTPTSSEGNTESDVIKTTEAQVDLGNGTIEGNAVVEGKGSMGEIRGQDGFKVEKRPEGKKVITLKGLSRVVINTNSLKKEKGTKEEKEKKNHEL